MASRGRASYRGARGGAFSRRQPKGLFKDNIWHCDCDPRLPAEHFKVKKEGKNQGRWFYTCQQSEPKRCGFFLWDEEAKPREGATVLANGHAEPQMIGHEVHEALAPRDSFISHLSSARGIKRTSTDAELDSAGDEWAMSRLDEADLTRVADAAVPSTPSKTVKTGVYATPSTTNTTKRKLPWLDATAALDSRKSSSELFQTPSRSSNAQPFDDSATTPTAANRSLTAPRSPSPPTRHRDALYNPADSASSLTVEALTTLAPIAVPQEIISSLRSILSKHDLKTQGILKGRDISRLALKAKDAKIAELEAKIVSLEAEREVDRSVIQELHRQRAQHGGRRGHVMGGDEDTQDEL